VIDPRRRVVIWNHACERLTGVAASEVLGTTQHWRAFYASRRCCLADLVALDRPDKLADLYSQHLVRSEHATGYFAENRCVMPKLGNHPTAPSMLALSAAATASSPPTPCLPTLPASSRRNAGGGSRNPKDRARRARLTTAAARPPYMEPADFMARLVTPCNPSPSC
jgi:hypothetical protein